MKTTIEGKLAGLLKLPGVTDLLINSFDAVYLARAARPLERIPSPFENDEEVASAVRELIQTEGRHIDQANPFADCFTRGLRVHAILASGCTQTTRVSIRVHQRRNFGLDQLAELGALAPEVATFLRAVVLRRESFLISGSTGSGKTTLLRAMLLEATQDRIVAIEDVPELQITSGHFVSLTTRQSNVENRGEITIDQLLREALRMRPDRLVVGEVRSVELITLLEALNTGHTGSGSTIHANSLSAVPSRLELLGHRAGINSEQLARLVSAAFSWVIQLENHRVTGIGRVENQDRVRLQDVWP